MGKLRLLVLAGLASLGATASGHAGGFQRSQADVDLLFEPGRIAGRAGFSYIDPQRGFSSINGVEGDYGTYTGDYRLPSFAVKYGDGPVACAGTYVQSFAAEADYTGGPGGANPASPDHPFGSRNRRMEFDSDEFAATCRASLSAGPGRLSFIGGIYVEDFDFSASSFAVVPSGKSAPTPFGAAPVYLPAKLDVEADSGYSPGFRAGLAYEIPTIALRAQVLYRSQTTHEAPGGSAAATLADTPFVLAPGIGRVNVPSPLAVGSSLPVPAGFSLNDVTSPQSLNLNVQTGIAPGTLLLASLRWTDWSTNRELEARIGDAPATLTPFFWRDGYTASLGLGRALTDWVSVLGAVGFDRGVSTGAETTYTDLYTVSGGLSFKPRFGEIRVGGLLGRWTRGSQSVSRGALFDATVGGDLVYAVNGSLRLAF